MEQMDTRQGALEEQMAHLTSSVLEKGESYGSGYKNTEGQNSGVYVSGGSLS